MPSKQAFSKINFNDLLMCRLVSAEITEWKEYTYFAEMQWSLCNNRTGLDTV